jgi:hypothetical protein
MARPTKIVIERAYLKSLNQVRKKRKADPEITKIELLVPKIDQKKFEELIFADGYKIELTITYKKRVKHARVGRK